MVQMGFNAEQVTAFLDHIGIAEENPNWILTYLNNPQYRNIMKDSEHGL